MADRLSLNMIATGLRAGLDEVRRLVATPEAALAVAERLLREDPAAVADFSGDAGNLAGWLLNESRRGRQVQAADLVAPDADPMPGLRASWDRSAELRAEFGGDFEAFAGWHKNEERRARLDGRRAAVADDAPSPAPAAKPAEARTATPAAPPAREQFTATPAVKLHEQRAAPAALVPLTTVCASVGIGLLDRCPHDAVMAGLRANGIAGRIVNDAVHLAADDVAKLRDREAQKRLVAHAIGTV